MATNDMMLTMAYLVRRYRVSLLPGETGDCAFDDWSDRFMSDLGRLRWVFEVRKD
ncbi:hypothetical protein BJX76DRAFT_321262 [Aspergillus varians]